MHAPGGPARDDGHRDEEPDRPGRQDHVRTAGPYAPRPHRPADFVRLSSNGRLSHPLLFEREGGIGSPMAVPGTDVPFQNEGSLQCWMVGLIIGALVLVLVILMAYQRYVAGKKPVQHLCDYCGHMVTAVSDCHHAPVRERFLHGTCLECKQDCRLVCARCKNPL